MAARACSRSPQTDRDRRDSLPPDSCATRINAAPVTFLLDGRQHVAIAAERALFVFALGPGAGPMVAAR